MKSFRTLFAQLDCVVEIFYLILFSMSVEFNYD